MKLKHAKRWFGNTFVMRALRAQGGVCCYCDLPVEIPVKGNAQQNNKTATREHIKPKSKGGADTAGNTAVACWRCNRRRSSNNWLKFKSMMRGEWHPDRPDDFSGVFDD